MSLITPDFGLLVWMTLIFGIVFFILAKFGFPAITGMVDKRGAHIEESLRKAEEAEQRLAGLAQEQAKMIEEARQEQNRILKEAAAARDQIVAQAKQQAEDEASKIIAHAKTEIVAERESAMRDISRQVSLISVEVAEKIIRQKLQDTAEQQALVDRLVDEVSRIEVKN